MAEEESSTATITPVLTDQERECAHNALQEFKKGNYIGCLQQLNKLDNRSNDYKVVHNKAVAEFYKSDLKKTDQFKKSLNTVFSMARMRPEVIDDVEQCVAQYNLAVLLYHQQQYASALKIVNRLLSFIEPMDDCLSHRVCLLLIELHIATFQPKKGLNLINYIENQITNVNAIPLLLSSGDREIKILKKDAPKKKIDSATTAFQAKLLKFQVRCNLMLHDLKTASRDVTKITSGETSIGCLKANIEYLKGNHKEAIRILQSMPPNELEFKTCGESSTILFYNNMGIIHHSLGKYHLAVHYIQQALRETDNNINSLNKFEPNEPLSGRPLYTLDSAHKHELMLNLGITLLHAGRATHAFDCFVMAVQRYHRNPRIWLRLAECCIQVHKSSNKVDFDYKKQSKIVQEQIGTGKHKKIILVPNLSKDKKYSAESQSYAVPVPTLEFGILCLRNALFLLPAENTNPPPTPIPAATTLTGPSGPPQQPTGPNVAPSSMASKSELNSLRKSVLAAAAYVTLCLGDYVMTLKYSKTLLEQPDLSSIHKLLAHLYASEALVLMNKVSEALKHLDLDLFKNISLNDDETATAEKDEFKTDTKPVRRWFPDNVETIQSLLRYNLAVALVYHNELEKASETLKQVWMSKSTICHVPIHVVMLVLYIELKLGRTELSKSLVKQHCLKFRPS